MDSRIETVLSRPVVAATLRVLALVAVAANVAYNALYSRLAGGADTLAAITARHPSPFTPANYAFAIWGLIYLGFVAYAVWQFAPRRRTDARVGVASLWLIAINALAALWIALFTQEWLGRALVPLVAGFAGAIGFRAAVRSLPAWIRAVASVYLGWSAVAALAGVALWLAPSSTAAASVADTAWATLFVLAAFGFGMMALLDGDVVVPAVVAWALAAIFVAARVSDAIVSFVALALAVVLACSALAALAHIVKPRGYSSILYPRP